MSAPRRDRRTWAEFEADRRRHAEQAEALGVPALALPGVRALYGWPPLAKKTWS